MSINTLPTNNLESLTHQPRIASVSRTTKETDIRVQVNLDGQGKCNVNTGVPFLDHMLHQLCSHGLLDLDIQATGDIEIDDHHTNEDVGITLGQAIAQAVGNRKGIHRFGHFVVKLAQKFCFYKLALVIIYNIYSKNY